LPHPVQSHASHQHKIVNLNPGGPEVNKRPIEPHGFCFLVVIFGWKRRLLWRFEKWFCGYRCYTWVLICWLWHQSDRYNMLVVVPMHLTARLGSPPQAGWQPSFTLSDW